MQEQTEELVRRAQDGERDAFTALVHHFSASVLRVVCSVLRQGHEAEDLVQETFLRAYLHLHELREPRAFGRWLNQTALRLALNHAQRSQPILSLDELAPIASHPDPTAQTADLHWAMQGMASCIEALPPAYRVTLLLREQAGLSYEEIAAHLGIPIGTVRSRLATARQHLQNCLRAAGHAPEP